MSQELIEQYLQQQSELSVVEEFALRHDLKQIPAGISTYQELIPKKTPGPGEQYAFNINLDQCTGCKACVTACHNENGLPEDETWRTVGLLSGGSTGDALMQNVTSACHHCLDPACLNGCPVNAYEKDLNNGIVRHLDDQCIGCQYCTFTCAYDVPKYNKKKGIVHKCDMCVSRLNVGEAPACVRACPNGAIRIALVDTAAVRNHPENFVNIPDAPDSNYTLPTTRYETKRKFPQGTIALDSLKVESEHAHWPLVGMLVLTQLSVGTVIVGIILNGFVGLSRDAGAAQAWAALASGLLAIAVSILHLGRPLFAFRAVLGLKHSWLSREIVAFGIFAVLAAAYAANYWYHSGENILSHVLALATALMGLTGVWCSIMVYKVTRRPFWDHPHTTFKFMLTMMQLGLSMGFLISTVLGSADVLQNVFICRVLVGVAVFKLILEGVFFRYLKDEEWTPFRKTAFLMSQTLRSITNARFILGITGGIILPGLLGFANGEFSFVVNLSLATAIFIFSLSGEFLERFLFFRAVVPLKMPGSKMY